MQILSISDKIMFGLIDNDKLDNKSTEYCSTEDGLIPKSFCLNKYFYLVYLVYFIRYTSGETLSILCY